MAEKINIRGVEFDNVSFSETVEQLLKSLKDGRQTALFTPNSEIVQSCIDNPCLYDVINSGDLIVPDGIGVIKAGRILGTPFKAGKVAGIEVGEALLKQLAALPYSVFFLGGKPGVAERARDTLLTKYPGITFVGCENGYFQKEGAENNAILEKINRSGADVLFVCLGAPTQEKWIAANRSRLPQVKLMLGLGGSLDGYAGTVKRAPKFFIRLGLEWFYRLLCEPWRFKRMLSLPKFYFGTWKYKFTRKP